MPLEWRMPAEFLRYNGIIVYHVYKNDDDENRSSNWFTLDPSDSGDSGYLGNGDNQFDARELPTWKKNHDAADHNLPDWYAECQKQTIKEAIDADHFDRAKNEIGWSKPAPVPCPEEQFLSLIDEMVDDCERRVPEHRCDPEATRPLRDILRLTLAAHYRPLLQPQPAAPETQDECPAQPAPG